VGAPELTVLVLVLDEPSNLDQTLSALREALNSMDMPYELLVVEGGYPPPRPRPTRGEGDFRLVRSALPGYGGAIRAGFAAATGAYILTLEADGSHDPSVIASLWAAKDQADVVIASRYRDGGAADMPQPRKALSRMLNLVYRRGLSLPVRDLSSGYRLYRRESLRSLSFEANDFDLLEEILIRMMAAGHRIVEVPFRYHANRASKSRARLTRFAKSYVRTFGAMWKLRNSIASADYDARAFDSIIPLQRYWQRRRHAVITSMAAGAGTVLDVGCGSSRIIGSRQLVGLDIVLAKLRYARRYGNPLVHGSIFALPFKDATFDAVICSEVIEHVPADAKVFDELERVLKPGGRLILGTPDYDRWRWRALEWMYGRLSPGGYADEHITQFGRANLSTYLEARGMAIEAIEYVGGSEMILNLRRPQAAARPTSPLPVAAGLRNSR
jgi:dolichol-phosphate mannosyltransferase